MRAALERLKKHEVMADDLATRDFQFHLKIAEATGNPYIVETLRNLGVVIVPRRRLDSAHLFHDNFLSYEQRIHDEHERIYQAILRQDVECARAAMRLHLDDSREHLQQVHEQNRARE